MRAFLTGATGSVGREVYRALRGRGVEARIAARKSRAVANVLPGASDLVTLDFGAPSISPTQFEEVDAFFFMTPLIETQVSAALRVLNAAIDAGVPGRRKMRDAGVRRRVSDKRQDSNQPRLARAPRGGLRGLRPSALPATLASRPVR